MPILNDLLPTEASVVSNITTDPAKPGGAWYTGIDVQKGAIDPRTFVYNAAIILIWALGILAVITFIWGGVKYITAGGDAEKAESAKKVIIGSIIGMLIIMSSYIIFNSAVTALSPTTNQFQTQEEINQLLDKTYK